MKFILDSTTQIHLRLKEARTKADTISVSQEFAEAIAQFGQFQYANISAKDLAKLIVVDNASTEVNVRTWSISKKALH